MSEGRPPPAVPHGPDQGWSAHQVRGGWECRYLFTESWSSYERIRIVVGRLVIARIGWE